LPPYSPDFNLIEQAFAELKAWMKRHRRLADDFDNLGEFVEHAFENLENSAAGHFVKSRVGIEICDGDDSDYYDD
jgi:hypothetical protein